MDYFIHSLLPIIVIVVSLTVGAYIAVLLNKYYREKQQAFIQSLFYHQVLLLIFGIYGLVGTALMSNFLLKYYVDITIIKKIVSIVFYLSYPFMISSVFMLIKGIVELVNKEIKSLWGILYFMFTVILSIILAFTIDDILAEYDVEFFVSSKYLLFLFYEIMLVVFLLFFVLKIGFSKAVEVHKKSAIIFFFVFHLSISGLFLLANYNEIARLYFLLLLFSGNSFLIYIIPKLETKGSNAATNNKHDEIFIRYGITNREREIILEICKGKTNQEIADTFFISLQTVKDHIHNIFGKVAVKNRVQLRNIFS